MKNSIRLAIFLFGVLLTGLLPTNASGQTRTVNTVSRQMAPATTWAPVQGIRPFPAWSDIWFSPFRQTQVSPIRPISILPQPQVTIYRTLLLPNGNIIRIR